MKNRPIILAVLVFSLLVGANVAFGVSAPSQDPQSASTVFPTFSGVDLKGPLLNTSTNGPIDDPSRMVRITDNLIVTGDGSALEVSSFEDDLVIGKGAVIGTGLRVGVDPTAGGFVAPGAAILGNVYIGFDPNTNQRTPSNLNVWGDIIRTETAAGTGADLPVTINDLLKTVGLIDAIGGMKSTGIIDARGGIANNNVVTGPGIPLPGLQVPLSIFDDVVVGTGTSPKNFQVEGGTYLKNTQIGSPLPSAYKVLTTYGNIDLKGGFLKNSGTQSVPPGNQYCIQGDGIETPYCSPNPGTSQTVDLPVVVRDNLEILSQYVRIKGEPGTAGLGTAVLDVWGEIKNNYLGNSVLIKDNLDVQGMIKDSSMWSPGVGSDFTIDDDVQVNGKIMAPSFGTFYDRTVDFPDISATRTAAVTIDCAPYKIISCNVASSVGQVSIVQSNERIDYTNNSCTGHIKNTSAGTLIDQSFLQALCWSTNS